MTVTFTSPSIPSSVQQPSVQQQSVQQPFDPPFYDAQAHLNGYGQNAYGQLVIRPNHNQNQPSTNQESDPPVYDPQSHFTVSVVSAPPRVAQEGEIPECPECLPETKKRYKEKPKFFSILATALFGGVTAAATIPCGLASQLLVTACSISLFGAGAGHMYIYREEYCPERSVPPSITSEERPPSHPPTANRHPQSIDRV